MAIINNLLVDKLGFQQLNVKKFTNTKILGQILIDLRWAIERYSLTLLAYSI